MTRAEIETEVSNAKLWAVLSLDSATLVSAQFVSSCGDEVQSVWSQRDLVASRKRHFSSTYILSKKNKYIATPPVEISESAPECYYSPSRKRFLKFTSSSNNGTTEANAGSIIAEVWTVGGGLDLSWEIDRATHGPVFTDEWFGSVSWSPDEEMVVYAADRPNTALLEKVSDKQESWIYPLAYKFHEDAKDPFGEAYIARRSPTLYVADVVRGSSFPLCEEDTADMRRGRFGEPHWSPNGEKIVATLRRSTGSVAGKEAVDGDFLPPDLGLRYCYNRQSSIVLFDAPQPREDLSSGSRSMQLVSSEENADDFCCNSPRFSPDGKDILYVSAPRISSTDLPGKVLPHNTTKVLRTVRVGESGLSVPRTLISIPENPGHKDFPGLYLHSLPENPWIGPDTVVFNTIWGSVNKALSTTFARDGDQLVPAAGDLKLVDWGSVLSGANLGGQTVTASYNIIVLDVCENAILISANNPVTPTILFSVRPRNWKTTESEVEVFAVSQASNRAQSLYSLLGADHTVDLVTQNDVISGTAREYEPGYDKAHLRYQVTVLLPTKTKEKTPFIVFPHGGPHTATLNGYSQGTAALLKRGFAVMYVNYRGSLGLGQKSLETLPGNVGTQEVCEVAQATKWALGKAEFFLDTERVGFVGGSHSGFIGAHTSLIPGLFKRTVLRNPVVNLATMVGATDIPDWCFCEAGVNSKNENAVRFAPDADQLRIMYEHSPVSRVQPVEDPSQRPGPTLLQVGGSDRRVPPQQSLEWKRILTQAYGANSVTIRWYPASGHAIDEVPNGDDAWVRALDFLCKL